MKNLELYEKYKKVPASALKEFNNGKFSGTDINTMWRIKSLTEEFGICGIGWYYDIIRLWSEPAPDNAVMCFAEIKLYIKKDNEWSRGISATGGSQIVQYFSSKKYTAANDEGYKMALTDAFGVACKYLGLGADVYWDNDKSKYTQEYDKPTKPPAPAKPLITETVKRITALQIAELKGLGANEAGLCTYFNVNNIADLTEAQAADAIRKKKGDKSA